MSQHNYRGHLSNVHNTGVEIGNYMSDRYGPPKPKIETVLWVKPHELTLADLHRLVNMTDNYPDSTRVHIHKDRIVAAQEETKPVEMEHRGNGHLHFATGPFTQNTEEFVEQMRRMKRREESLKSDSKNDLPPRDELGRFKKRKDS